MLSGKSNARIDRVIIEETAKTWAALLFGAFAIVTLGVFRNMIRTGAVLAAWFESIALYAAVSSLFIGDHDRRALILRRRLGPWSFDRVYDSAAIDRVWVRETLKRQRAGRSIQIRA